MLNNLYQITVQLNTLTQPLRELLKDVDFGRSKISNEAVEKLCVNNDTCFRYFDKSIYKV